MTQWVAGFVRCMQEEKLECNRVSMLDYLVNSLGLGLIILVRQPRVPIQFCLLTWKGTGLNGGIPTILTLFIGHTPRGISLPKILPCILLVRNQRLLVGNTVLFASTFIRVPINFKAVIGLLVSVTEM